MRRSLLFKIHILILLLLPSCIKLSAEPANADTVHVIIIGFDGWDSASFDSADMPFLKSMLPESAWTLHKRSILPSSSACNWATMFKGAGPEAHGYIDWNSKSPAFEVAEKNRKGFFPSIFSVFRENHQNSEMGYIYQWEGMKYIIDLDDFNFALKIADTKAGSEQMRAVAVSYLMQKKPSIAAFIWACPDEIGHQEGWGAESYMKELNYMDSIIESIVNACIEAEIYDNSLFVIVSDHGGHEKTHGQPLMSDIETPFVVFGPGVNPGEITEPLMQYDIASLIADYLHLPQPSSWRGRTPIDLFK